MRQTGNITIREVRLSVPEPMNESRAAVAAFVADFLPGAFLATMLPVLVAGCVSASVLAIMLASSLLAVLAFSTASARGLSPQKLRVAAFACIVLCLLATLALPSARQGLFALSNGIVSSFDEAFSLFIGLASSGETVAASPLFGIFAGAVCGVLGWAGGRLRATGAVLATVVALSAAALVLGCGVGYLGAALGMVGWLVMMRLGELRDSQFRPLSLCAATFMAMLSCVVVFWACQAAYYPGTQAIDDVRQTAAAAINQARYGSDTLPEGDMSQATTMNNGSEERLEVKLSGGQVGEDVLLHGFAGARFEDGQWAPLSHTAYEGQWTGLRSWLAGEGFAASTQRAAYDSESQAAGGPQEPTATLEVSATGANRKYLYTPFSLRSLENAVGFTDVDGMALAGAWRQRSYRITMDSIDAQDLLADTSWLAASQSSFAQAESVQNAFVRENYLEVPTEEERAIAELIFNESTWDADEANDYATISRVRTMLQTLASYTENANAPKQGTAFCQWFLGSEHKGNSAYFATAATLAFRTQGIPARYVEGYRIDADSLTAAALNGNALTATSKDAHAWVEVYLAGQGWTPIEVTPGFYNQALQADQVMDVGELHGNGQSDDALEEGSVAGQIEEDQKDAPAPFVQLNPVRTLMGLVLLALIIAAATVVQRFVRIRRRTRLIESDDQAVCVPALYRYLSDVMQESPLAFDATRPLDSLEGFAQAFPGIDPREYQRAIQIHQSYAFGGHILKPNELRTLRRFTNRLHDTLPQPVSLKARLKRLFIKAL